MANDYDNLSIGTKALKVIAGFCPAIATWKITGSLWAALTVYIAGFIAGTALSNWYTGHPDSDRRVGGQRRDQARAYRCPAQACGLPRAKRLGNIGGGIKAAVLPWWFISSPISG
jgi:hypothetical protein